MRESGSVQKFLIFYFTAERLPLAFTELFLFPLQLSSLPAYGKLYAKLEKTLKEGYDALSIYNEPHMEYVKQGDYVFITDERTVEIEAAKSCGFAVGKEKYMPMKYGIGSQNNSVYKDLVSLL